MHPVYDLTAQPTPPVALSEGKCSRCRWGSILCRKPHRRPTHILFCDPPAPTSAPNSVFFVEQLCGPLCCGKAVGSRQVQKWAAAECRGPWPDQKQGLFQLPSSLFPAVTLTRQGPDKWAISLIRYVWAALLYKQEGQRGAGCGSASLVRGSREAWYVQKTRLQTLSHLSFLFLHRLGPARVRLCCVDALYSTTVRTGHNNIFVEPVGFWGVGVDP